MWAYVDYLDQMEHKLKIENPINILVQRRGAIGDVIMTTGVVRELKRMYGTDANIDVATDCFEVYRNNPHVRDIIAVNGADARRYEVFINLDDAYEINPVNHYVDSYFYRAFGKTTLNRSVELFTSVEDQRQVDQDLKDIGANFIVVHMRNWHWGAKNIALDVWFDVYAKLFEQTADLHIVCVGGNTDHYVDHPLFFDARDRYNSQQLKYLCDHAHAFVGIDSGPMQCAAASSTHIVALLTHLRPERIVPHRRSDTNWNATAIQTLEDCAGCNDRQARPVRQIVCEKGNYPCTNNFDAEAIATAILNTLKE